MRHRLRHPPNGHRWVDPPRPVRPAPRDLKEWDGERTGFRLDLGAILVALVILVGLGAAGWVIVKGSPTGPTDQAQGSAQAR